MRPRIAFADAQLVRERVEKAAADSALRGARRHALAATLKLLCGWSRVADDQVSLAQVVELITAAGGRRYDLKTIGRALTSLAAAELIVYRAAQGRGQRAFVAIHDRFLDGISVLDRDAAGRVVTASRREHSVTFSESLPYKNQTLYLPTLRSAGPTSGTRPTGVEISTPELISVLRALPAPMATLPKHLRWLLGREIRHRLQAGWTPQAILEVLSAPMPADVRRPWRLALWRLRHNIIGAGPRLRPLQRAWDLAEAAATKARTAEATTRWYGDVCAVTDRVERTRILAAHEVKFGRRAVDPVSAIAAAGRRAARLFPQLSLASALARWINETVANHAPSAAEPLNAAHDMGLAAELASGDCACVVCASRHATARAELPLKSMVCDQCWPVIAADLLGASDDQGKGVAA